MPDHLNAEVEQWGSTNPIITLAQIKTKPEEFPYLDRVKFNLQLRIQFA